MYLINRNKNIQILTIVYPYFASACIYSHCNVITEIALTSREIADMRNNLDKVNLDNFSY